MERSQEKPFHHRASLGVDLLLFLATKVGKKATAHAGKPIDSKPENPIYDIRTTIYGLCFYLVSKKTTTTRIITTATMMPIIFMDIIGFLAGWLPGMADPPTGATVGGVTGVPGAGAGPAAGGGTGAESVGGVGVTGGVSGFIKILSVNGLRYIDLTTFSQLLQAFC